MVLPGPKKVNIGQKIMNFVFIRYVYNKSACKFLVCKSSIKDTHPNTITKSSNAIFFGYMFLFKEAYIWCLHIVMI
jgi:hypothetical protein